MKMFISSTEFLTVSNGKTVRVWNGVSEDGVACRVLVERIAAVDAAESDALAREMNERLPVGRIIPIEQLSKKP